MTTKIIGTWVQTTSVSGKSHINEVWTIYNGVLHVWQINVETEETVLMQGKETNGYRKEMALK